MITWQRGAAGGGQIKHKNTVRDLVAAARLPLLTAVVKIKAHLRSTTAEQLGNHWADLTAKADAGAVLTPTHAAPATEVRDVNILDVQNCAQPREIMLHRCTVLLPALLFALQLMPSFPEIHDNFYRHSVAFNASNAICIPARDKPDEID
ncbi:hypothetical protein chiPu_0025167, partial [Chiloscyllium punctatum]|nr:hypothetical protein [Chiloscyllium punctatum]